MAKTITVTISDKAVEKLKAVKVKTGSPYNFQIEKAILEGD